MDTAATFHGKIDLRDPVTPIRPYGMDRSKPPAEIEPFFLLDDLAYIGSISVGCFVVTTSEGIVLIDSLETEDAYDKQIKPALKKLGLGDKKILACFITHGHFDHHAGAGLLRERTGCRLIMSETDMHVMPKPSPRGIVHPYPKTIDIYCEDGDKITFGDKTFHIALTPGHTPGGISIVFPVTDKGEKHMACIWGGTGLPQSLYECCDYLKSAIYFAQFCQIKNADVEISAHPFVDHMLETKEKLMQRKDGEANPFVIGEKGVSDFMYQRCITAMTEIAKYVNQM